MAEVLSTAVPVEETSSTSKSRRHSRFSAEEDIIIVREVAAAKANMAALGEVRKSFEAAAAKANQNPSLKQKVSWKTVQDRYKRLQDQFDKAENDNQKFSGLVGGEMGEMSELLMTMREAHDDFEARKDAEKTAAKKKEADKEKVGEQLMLAATKRKNNGSESAEDKEDDVEEDRESGATSAKKKRTKRNLGNDMAGEMERFVEHLRDAKLAKVSLERDRLQFEREKYDLERNERDRDKEERREERDADRRERKEERECQADLELAKFKLMMEAFAKK